MNNYKTVKECAVDIICKEGHLLNNNEIASKVSKIMNSKTTHKCIASYKNKINRGTILVNKEECKWINSKFLTQGKNLNNRPFQNEIDDLKEDSVNFENEAERFVYNYEFVRTGVYPKKMKNNSNNSAGYDFQSVDRHIEVKGKKNGITTWIQLTSNETDTLIKDPKYYLYLVEGDIENNPDNVELFIIGQQDLLSMVQLKIHARLTQLSNIEKRKKWKQGIGGLKKFQKPQ